MSFTKIPNFSNCNIWLPLQQLNIVMKYHHTRVKSTSFSKFYLHFFHLYIGKMLSIHFFFHFNNTSNSSTTLNVTNLVIPPPPQFFFLSSMRRRERSRNVPGSIAAENFLSLRSSCDFSSANSTEGSVFLFFFFFLEKTPTKNKQKTQNKTE